MFNFVVLDHFAYGNKYTSPQSQRKIMSDEISSLPHHKRLLADDRLLSDDSLIFSEHKKTDIMANKFELPLNDFKDFKINVCI